MASPSAACLRNIFRASPAAACRVAGSFAPAILTLLVLLAGCGEPNPLGRRPIAGKVTLKGQPVDYGGIQFIPHDLQNGVSSGGMIESGRYTLTLLQGLPPGKYKVMISSPDRGKQEKVEGPPGEERVFAVERVPKIYNVDTKLEIEVTKGRDTQEANFELQ